MLRLTPFQHTEVSHHSHAVTHIHATTDDGMFIRSTTSAMTMQASNSAFCLIHWLMFCHGCHSIQRTDTYSEEKYSILKYFVFLFDFPIHMQKQSIFFPYWACLPADLIEKNRRLTTKHRHSAVYLIRKLLLFLLTVIQNDEASWWDTHRSNANVIHEWEFLIIAYHLRMFGFFLNDFYFRDLFWKHSFVSKKKWIFRSLKLKLHAR